MKINSPYLKLFMFVGIPVTAFLATFFSLMIGFKDGFMPGLLIGLCVGSVMSAVLGFLYSKSTKDVMSDVVKEIEVPKNERKKSLIVLLPIPIIFLGAFYTRYSGQMLLPYLVTIILSIIVVTLYYYLSGAFKRLLQQGELISLIAANITLLIPFTVTYFIFLLVLYGFNFEEIRKLFQL